MADTKVDLVALRAMAEEAEAAADNAITDEESVYAELSQRIDAANERKRKRLEQVAMAKMLDRLAVEKEIANGAYVVEILDVDQKTSGAGKYIVRSPTSQAWKTVKEALARANGDEDKASRAERVFAIDVIVFPKVGKDMNMDDLSERFDRFPGLASSIALLATDLGGIAAGARKR